MLQLQILTFFDGPIAPCLSWLQLFILLKGVNRKFGKQGMLNIVSASGNVYILVYLVRPNVGRLIYKETVNISILSYYKCSCSQRLVWQLEYIWNIIGICAEKQKGVLDYFPAMLKAAKCLPDL